MSEKVMIKGYQPVINLQDGYQPMASVQTGKGQPPKINIVPPQGGTGEVTLKK